jgi:cobalt/nickel transport protein
VLKGSSKKSKNLAIGGFLISILLAGVVSFYASTSPDGLEKVAGEIGFSKSAEDHSLSESPLADYGIKGVENQRISTGLAGVVGVAATGVISFGLFYLIRRKNGTEK